MKPLREKKFVCRHCGIQFIKRMTLKNSKPHFHCSQLCRNYDTLKRLRQIGIYRKSVKKKDGRWYSFYFDTKKKIVNSKGEYIGNT